MGITSNLIEYAKDELDRAGLFDKDSDYDGRLGESVMELVRTFRSQGHSGYSAHRTIELFSKVAKYEPLTAIGESKDEWIRGSLELGYPYWQNARRMSTFSRDHGITWFDIENPKLNNGDTWVRRPWNELAYRIRRAIRGRKEA